MCNYYFHNDCFRGEMSNNSVAYLVREREVQITELKAQLAEMQRALAAQSKIVQCDTGASRKTSRLHSAKSSKLSATDSDIRVFLPTGSKNQLVSE